MLTEDIILLSASFKGSCCLSLILFSFSTHSPHDSKTQRQRLPLLRA